MFIAPNLNSPICDEYINRFLTILGWIHICFQPYFTHMTICSFTKNKKYIETYKYIKRLSLLCGFLLLARYFITEIPELNKIYNVYGENSTEW